MDRKLYLKSYLENLVKKDKPENVLVEKESESLKNAFDQILSSLWAAPSLETGG